MDGNEGTLGGIGGDLAAQLCSLRIGGTFTTRAALSALPAKSRKTGMVACVLEDGSLWVFDADAVDEGIEPEAGAGRWRPIRTQNMLYERSKSLLAAALVDADGHVESIATKTTADVLTGAELDGALVDADNIGRGPVLFASFWPTLTTGAHVGAHVIGSDIIWTGTYNGEAVTRTATLTSADGSETLFADGPLDTLTQIDIEAQADTDGTFTFGFSGISPMKNGAVTYKKWLVKSYADAANADTANVHVGYADGSEDTVELAKGAQLEASPIRIYGDSTAPITIYE